MATSTIAFNLRLVRKSTELSQECVAEKAGLSRAAYRKIENGESEPRVSSLQAIAGALGVKIQDLVAPVRELKAVRFRSNKRVRRRERILADTSRWLADCNDLEDLLGEKIECRIKPLPSRGASSADFPSKAAAKVREALGKNSDEPIRDTCGLLEARGVKVCSMPIEVRDFFGLSIAASDGGPAIVVNTWKKISVERWIFTAAHELGHLVLHLGDYSVGETGETAAHEAEANAFASALLMPDPAFRREWENASGLSLVERVLKVKRIFCVSYRTVLFRLVDSKIMTDTVWARFRTEYKRFSGRTLLGHDEPVALAKDAFGASFPESRMGNEPEGLSRVDFAGDRLSRLVRMALESEKISLSRGAEILRLSLQDMRALAASWVG